MVKHGSVGRQECLAHAGLPLRRRRTPIQDRRLGGGGRSRPSSRFSLATCSWMNFSRLARVMRIARGLGRRLSRRPELISWYTRFFETSSTFAALFTVMRSVTAVPP